jgi:hypothetical protein
MYSLVSPGCCYGGGGDGPGAHIRLWKYIFDILQRANM